ncbi:MAG: serine/threonine-protein kinase [Deltaproteobacteria bacterium]|nr:serine/threonine-protein kinase [Myxococcales bacterium]MDP3216189.1 serine/threonine-protein kinase [Deltaproteobacteria bacterium]
MPPAAPGPTPTSDEPPLPAGHLVGRWRLLRLLGSGGTASVYEAQHTELPRRAAIKVLHHRYAYSHEMRSRFLREGRAAASIAHPHVVAVHDVGLSDDHLFLVMDLLDGESLRDRIRRDGPLPPPLLVSLFTPLADALSAVHAAGILHRDVSPANVLLVPASSPADAPPTERAVLLDFSSAHIDEPSTDAPLTRSHALLGTPAYMSPEQCRGARDLDARTDVFSLGAVLYLAATGHPPFTGDTWQALLVDVLSGRRTPPTQRNPAIPPALAALIQRAMAHDPAQRFPDAASLRDALRSLDLRPRASRRAPFALAALAALGALATLASSLAAPPAAPALSPPATSDRVLPTAPGLTPNPAVTPPVLAAPPVAVAGLSAPSPAPVRPPTRPAARPSRPHVPTRSPTLPPPHPAPQAPSSGPEPGELARGTNNALILPHSTP